MKGLTAAVCVFCFAFAVARAVRVPLTYDEAAAYLRYIAIDVSSVFNTDLLSIFNFEVATNHFLNTLLTKLSSLVLGDSELALRMPNLIGYAMYLCFSVLILRRRTHPAIALAGLLLLNLNPYVLDFFALSRGYGLSLGFMMAALFFFFRCLDQLHSRAASLDLSRALLFACGAVMANFAMLNVFVGMWAVSLAALAVSNQVTRRPSAPKAPDEPTASPGRRSYVWLLIVAAVFTAAVFSQDPGLSRSLYEPVNVRVSGLSEADLNGVSVTRIDLRGRETGLRRDPANGMWRSGQREHFRGIRVDVPIVAADRLARIEVIVGHRAFSHDPHQAGAWYSTDIGAMRRFESGVALSTPRSRMPAFRPVMNWAGDQRYIGCVAWYTAIAILVLAMLAVLLECAGRLTVRTKILTGDQWRPLALGALWVAALAGSPLYLLKRESQLYFGGTRGLIQDTFYSLIENSFYGRTYHLAQVQIAFAVIMATVAAFAIAAYVSYRRKMLRTMLQGGSLLTIIVMIWLSLIAQRLMFDTVYLAGRTALLFIPLYVLFLTLLCQAIFTLGRMGRVAATLVLIAALTLSACHFATTANVKYTWDWPDDAATKTMMEDLAFVIAAEHPSRSRTTLGVDRIYAPVAVYYAHRHEAAGIDIVVAPFGSSPDFLYVEQSHARPGMNVLRRYSVARSVLARGGATR